MTWSARRSVLAIVGLGLVSLAATALASNSAAFDDPAGDASAAPDLARVAVSNDDVGTITLKIELANEAGQAADGEVAFAVDVDQNPDTGSNYYGTEFAMALEDLKPTFFGVDAAGEFAEGPRPPSFQASFAGGVASFVFKGPEVGIAPSSGFNLVAIGARNGFVDTAPDIRTSNYQLVAGTPPLTTGPDTRAPVDEAVKSAGTHGKRAELLYYVADGRAETADTVQVYRGAKLLKTIHVSFNDTNPFFEYSALWRVPKKVRGKLRFCVSSVDRAGNKSNRSCAALRIK